MALLKTFVQNIRIQTFSSCYHSNSKIQTSTYKKSPNNCVKSCNINKICCKNISCNCAYATTNCRLLCSFFQNKPPTSGQKKVHSKPPNANILSTKIISGGLIVRTITTIPNIIVITVLIDLTFFSYDLFFSGSSFTT